MMDVLWKSKDVAGFLGVSARQVTERLVLDPSFPRPFRLPTDKGTRGHPRWLPEEVKKWLEKYRA